VLNISNGVKYVLFGFRRAPRRKRGRIRHPAHHRIQRMAAQNPSRALQPHLAHRVHGHVRMLIRRDTFTSSASCGRHGRPPHQHVHRYRIPSRARSTPSVHRLHPRFPRLFSGEPSTPKPASTYPLNHSILSRPHPARHPQLPRRRRPPRSELRQR